MAPPARESQEDDACLPRPLSQHPPSAHSASVRPCGELQPGPYTLSTLTSWGRDRGAQNGVVMDPAWVSSCPGSTKGPGSHPEPAIPFLGRRDPPKPQSRAGLVPRLPSRWGLENRRELEGWWGRAERSVPAACTRAQGHSWSKQGRTNQPRSPHLLWYLQLGHKQDLRPASSSRSSQPPSSGVQLHPVKSAPSLSYQSPGATAEPGNGQCGLSGTHGTCPSTFRFGGILSPSQEQRGPGLGQV